MAASTVTTPSNSLGTDVTIIIDTTSMIIPTHLQKWLTTSSVFSFLLTPSSLTTLSTRSAVSSFIGTLCSSTSMASPLGSSS